MLTDEPLLMPVMSDTVTTALAAFEQAVTLRMLPASVEPPFHDQTPSAPLTMTVNFCWPRLANEVQNQSSLVKPPSPIASIPGASPDRTVAPNTLHSWRAEAAARAGGLP